MQLKYLESVAQTLTDKALSPSTHKIYERALQQYSNFVKNHFQGASVLPSCTQHVILFIAKCFEDNLAASTVLTYISALSYFHKINNMTDSTNNFVVKKCLQGYQKSKNSCDSRRPITYGILKKLISSLAFTANSHFLRILLKAMYLLAFHALLRVGEFTAKTANSGNPILKAHDVTFKFDSNNLIPIGFELSLSGYKHSQGKITTLYIPKNETDLLNCPVHALWMYFKLREPKNGPIFTFMDGAPVTRSFFAYQLNLSLCWSGCNTKLYKSHSFRIGKATMAAAQGISDEVISRMGRWSSSAVKNYIRIPVFEAKI